VPAAERKKNMQCSHFAPPKGIAAVVAQAIQSATASIQLLIYAFTNPYLAYALAAAANRGVAVTVIFDGGKQHEPWGALATLKTAPVKTYADCEHSIMHNKICIVDSKLLLTGSYNWTYAAENDNAEALITTDDPVTVAAFQTEFAKHLSHSIPI